MSYPGVSGVSGSAVGRFAPQYGSFLLQSAAAAGHGGRLGPTATPSTAAHCSVKAEPWPGRYGPHDPLALGAADHLTGHPAIVDASTYTGVQHSYSNMAGKHTDDVVSVCSAVGLVGQETFSLGRRLNLS